MLSLAIGLYPALAQEPTYDQVNEIAKKLNCPTCAGLNLADCNTQTCAQWRDQINDLLKQGYTDEEVVNYFTTRYGEQVLQEPPKTGWTLALWTMPLGILLIAGGWLLFVVRGWAKPKVEVEVQMPMLARPSADTVGATSHQSYLRQVEQDLNIDES
jgi:cytochrome c-type biogenesis protein CcmH